MTVLAETSDSDVVVHSVALDHVVVELHEALTAPGPAIELHLVQESDTGSTVAWWEDDAGTFLGVARVGRG